MSLHIVGNQENEHVYLSGSGSGVGGVKYARAARSQVVGKTYPQTVTK